MVRRQVSTHIADVPFQTGLILLRIQLIGTVQGRISEDEGQRDF